MHSFTILYCSFLLVLISICTGAHQVDEKLLSPINIITSKVKQYALVEKPLTASISLLDLLFPIYVTNTGTAIILHGPSNIIRPVTFTGPLLNNEKYFLTYVQIYISQSLNRSGHSINGKGYPIEVANIYRNQKYFTFENASKNPDGIVVLSQPVRVEGFLDNPAFFEFENMLRSGAIRNPHSTGFLSPIGSFAWYDSFLIGHAFFKYNGSQYYSGTRKQISTATNLITQPVFYNRISVSQFKAFQNVLGLNGKPLNVVAPIYPQGSRKVEGTRGVVVNVTPFDISIPLL